MKPTKTKQENKHEVIMGVTMSERSTFFNILIYLTLLSVVYIQHNFPTTGNIFLV